TTPATTRAPAQARLGPASGDGADTDSNNRITWADLSACPASIEARTRAAAALVGPGRVEGEPDRRLGARSRASRASRRATVIPATSRNILPSGGAPPAAAPSGGGAGG